MRLTTIPLLAVRGPAPERPALRRIMVPLDGSALAREALPLALDLARRTGATLVLLTVLTPRVLLDPSIAAEPSPTAMESLREQMLHELDALAAECRDVQITTVIGEGLVGEMICREAEYHVADLIVMTSHGESGLRHFALGSVTDKVLRGTQVPVLVLHSRAHDARIVGGPSGAMHSTG
jgi:nucleotide-binding universal stress UspA family protein